METSAGSWIPAAEIEVFVLDPERRSKPWRLGKQRSPLHVVIDGRTLNRPTTGTERYLRNIISTLSTQKRPGDLIQVLVWQEDADPAPGVQYVTHDHMSAIRCADVFFKTFPASEPIYLEEMAAARACVFLPHDLIAYSHPSYFPTLASHLDFAVHLHTAINLSDGLISISSHNGLDMARRLPSVKHSATILHGVDQTRLTGAPELLTPLHLNTKRFFLSVGTDYPHKNLQVLIDAFVSAGAQLADYELVLVGKRFHRGLEPVLPDRVRHFDHVDDSVLAALLGNAAALVYPSLYEGFGLPPIEAMKAGLPVAASNATSLPEVCGDAALLFDASSIENTCSALIRIAHDEPLRKRLRKAGLRRASCLTWAKSGRKTWEFLKSVATSEQISEAAKQAILDNSRTRSPLGPTVVIVSHIRIHAPAAGNERRLINLVNHLRKSGYRVVLISTPLERTRCTPVERYRVLESVDLFYEILPNTDDDFANTTQWATTWRSTAEDPILARWRTQELTFCPDTTRAAVHVIVAQLKPIAVIAEYVWTSRVLTALPSSVLRIIDTHDMFSAKAARVSSYGVRDELGVLPDEERAFLDRADIVLAIQPEEAECFRRLGTKADVITVPCDMDVVMTALPFSQYPTVLIVASGNDMNVLFVDQFIGVVWPRVCSAVSGARLIVAGKVCSSLSTNSDCVQLLGFQEDLAPLYASAWVVANPVAAGTGLKIKSIEALANSKPLVTTSEGAAGLPAHDEPYLLLAETTEDWVDRLTHLLQSEPSRTRFAAAAADVARKTFGPETVYAPLLEVLKAGRNATTLG